MMLEPSKAELRQTIRMLRKEREDKRSRLEILERELAGANEQLDVAARLLGYQVIKASLKRERASVRLIPHRN
jgi:predicted  nucleic acid-binding Zn-ribbon protein